MKDESDIPQMKFERDFSSFSSVNLKILLYEEILTLDCATSFVFPVKR